MTPTGNVVIPDLRKVVFGTMSYTKRERIFHDHPSMLLDLTRRQYRCYSRKFDALLAKSWKEMGGEFAVKGTDYEY